MPEPIKTEKTPAPPSVKKSLSNIKTRLQSMRIGQHEAESLRKILLDLVDLLTSR